MPALNGLVKGIQIPICSFVFVSISICRISTIGVHPKRKVHNPENIRATVFILDRHILQIMYTHIVKLTFELDLNVLAGISSG